MSKLHIILCVLVATAFLAAAGCDDAEELATIEGSLTLDLGYGETGFEFEAPVDLVESPEDADPGCAAGGCIIHIDENGDAGSLEFWVDRGTAGEQGPGFRSFDVLVSGEGSTVRATAAVDDGLQTFTATGGAECHVSDLTLVDTNGDADLAVDCILSDDNGETAHATAGVLLTGCDVR